ncbi:MAG: M43 family zinc metalloprotease [Flavobacteriales bacterium]
MKSIATVILVCLSILGVVAQDHTVYYCGQVKAREKLFGQHVGAEEHARMANARLEEYTEEYVNNRGGDDEIYIIPVVFHIIHDNGEENISAEQVHDALEVLTRDFRKQNPDTTGIVDAFEDIAADVRIEFRLATKDPDGNCHTGINRIASELTYDGFNNDMKALSYWPRDMYLNIWVCNTIGSNTAGFTNLPGDVNSPWMADEDGIVIKHNYCGTIGTGSGFTSRTLTHEIGHWLNLYHTWGPGNSPEDPDNCGQSDLVSDTPTTIGWTSCNLSGASCGSDVDNVQNYMEYSYCSRMFTWGQRQRMRAALTSNTAQRNQLITQSNLEATGVLDPPLCVAYFTSPMTSVCVGDSVQFNDESYHNIVEWNWNFGDGNTLNGSDPATFKDPYHVYDQPGVYTVTLTVTNGQEQLTSEVTGFVTVFQLAQNDAPFAEGFENTWPANNWSIYNESNDETWEVTPTASYTDDKSLKLRNYNNDISGSFDVLYSATYDMSTATTIYVSYKWAYANRVNETDDMLRISVSGDCGATWQVRKIRKGLSNLPTATVTNTQFTPTTLDQWDSETLTLTQAQWFTSSFRVRFEFEGKGGNNLFLDDINITAEMPVGVEEAGLPVLVNLYPNPAEGNMTLEVVQPNSGNLKVSLFDATGRLCLIPFRGGSSSGKHLIAIPEQAAGMYYLRVEKDGLTCEKKVVFQ